MTVRNGHVRHRDATCPGRRAGIPAVTIAALLLAGCSSGNIGDSWQCPLATGGACNSVAAADPAVPKPARVQRGEPIRLLPLEASPNGADTPPMETRSCATDCGFDPFAWLERLFEGKGEEETGSAPAAAQPSLPGELDTVTGELASGDPEAGDLRTGETVARIWIAPFVDAEGIYREAAHVRVVLEPAGWRLR